MCDKGRNMETLRLAELWAGLSMTADVATALDPSTAARAASVAVAAPGQWPGRSIFRNWFLVR